MVALYLSPERRQKTIVLLQGKVYSYRRTVVNISLWSSSATFIHPKMYSEFYLKNLTFQTIISTANFKEKGHGIKIISNQ